MRLCSWCEWVINEGWGSHVKCKGNNCDCVDHHRDTEWVRKIG